MDPNASTQEKVENLGRIRMLVLTDAANYARALSGLIPSGVISASQPVEIQRWGASFLAESLASPMPNAEDKQQMSLVVLQTLRDYLDRPGQDASVIKSTVQAATSAYSIIFRYIIYHPNESSTWQHMAAIKSSILRNMDSWPTGVRACCVKFVQRVVQVQTPGLIQDPRRPEQNETSLALVPRDHPLIPPPNLEAEAQGLLDRLLGVFQESPGDPLLVTATLNCIGVLVRTRASIANRVLNAILSFNPLRAAANPDTPKGKVAMRSMERTTRAFLMNLNKRYPQHPMAGRIIGYLDHLHQSRLEMSEESRKRPAQTEPTDGLNSAKRQRLGAGDPPTLAAPAGPPPLPQGTVSVAELFTLTHDEGTRGFDVSAIPPDIISRIIVPIFQIIDQQQLDRAVNNVRARYLELIERARPPRAPDPFTDLSPDIPDSDDEDDEILNRVDSLVAPPDNALEPNLGPYVLEQPEPMTVEAAREHAKFHASRLFDVVHSLGDPAKPPVKQGGLADRVAAQDLDHRDTWITILARLAVRPTAHSDDFASMDPTPADNESDRSPGDFIRLRLLRYVLDNFRKRLDPAILWLNEEWHAGRAASPPGAAPDAYQKRYIYWALRLLDGILPYLDARDKILTRFLSEVPLLTPAFLDRVKRVALDPERVALAVNALYYLAIYRRPSTEDAVDALEDLWRNYDDARGLAGKFLFRFRPHLQPPVIAKKEEPEDVKQEEGKDGGGEGRTVKQEGGEPDGETAAQGEAGNSTASHAAEPPATVVA